MPSKELNQSRNEVNQFAAETNKDFGPRRRSSKVDTSLLNMRVVRESGQREDSPICSAMYKRVCRPHRVGVSLHRIPMEIPRLYGMLRKTSRFAVIVVLALLCGTRALAQSGRDDYQHYCAACHGQDGKGKGEWNGTAVPDLTRLRRNNGGRFPSEEIQKVVDGRSQPLWHQRHRDMPYWGEIFQLEEDNPASKAKVEARIAAIVDYVRGLQEK
jgi:hypothetical protein